MSDEIDYSNLPEFPKRIPEKLKTVRKRLNLSPDQIAPRVGAKSRTDIPTGNSDQTKWKFLTGRRFNTI
jgi:hypothetical protein